LRAQASTRKSAAQADLQKRLVPVQFSLST
jgi:hypothetical protein